MGNRKVSEVMLAMSFVANRVETFHGGIDNKLTNLSDLTFL